jgi:hypothetical protein
VTNSPSRTDATTTTRLPNLLIAGVKKAGTTSLFDYLGQHPDISPGDVKSTNHFSGLRLGRALPPVEHYAAHFSAAPNTRYRLEAPSTYFYGGRPMAEAIDRTLPKARVVVSLRDPVARLFSDFQMKRREKTLPGAGMPFAEYVQRCERAYADGSYERQQGLTGFARGVYSDVAGDWFDIFGDRLRVVFFERWAADPRRELRLLCQWLEIDAAPVDDIAIEVLNQRIDYRSKDAAALARRAYWGAARRVAAVRRLKPALVRLHDKVNGRGGQDRLSPAMRAHLEVAYAPANARLAQQLRACGQTEHPPWLETPEFPRSAS